MQPERWQQVKALLQSALEFTPGEREAFLNEACAGDTELRREVESYLKAHEQASEFIEQPAAAHIAPLLFESQADLTIGQKFGSYEVRRKIAEGGMGFVYLAVDTRLGRRVALKILPANFTLDVERVRRFRQEARAVSLLNHPNIVTIYEIGESQGNEFIITEFVEGETLRERIMRGSLNLQEIVKIVSQVADALSAAHNSGIIHRDIKPENIMLRPDGYVKVLDFGLAKLTEKTQQVLPTDFKIAQSKFAKTTPGMIIGTVAYMSPEQAQGLAVDERTDIWSLGVMLYEMSAGKLPFEGATPSHFIVAILEQEPTPLDSRSPEFEQIVLKALRKDRTERYQNIKEILSDINQLKKTFEFTTDLKMVSATSISNRNNLPIVQLKQKSKFISITAMVFLVSLILGSGVLGIMLWISDSLPAVKPNKSPITNVANTPIITPTVAPTIKTRIKNTGKTNPTPDIAPDVSKPGVGSTPKSTTRKILELQPQPTAPGPTPEKQIPTPRSSPTKGVTLDDLVNRPLVNSPRTSPQKKGKKGDG